jgi:hypothetical protein
VDGEQTKLVLRVIHIASTLKFSGRESRVRTESYNTNPLRVTLSLAAGAVTGAFLNALYYLWGTAQILGVQYVLDYGLPSSSGVLIVALVVWAVGLIVFGLPIWWLFHKLRLRHWLVAAVMGAATTFVVDFAIETGSLKLVGLLSNGTYSAGDAGGPTIIDSRLTPHGWWVSFQDALMLSAGGILVALVIWRIAYRRVDNLQKLLFRGS